MKSARLLFLALLFSVSFAQLQFESNHITATRFVNQVLEQLHYKNQPLDDNFSDIIYHQYLKDLDYNKAFFLASDIAEFDEHRYMFDDDLLKGNIRFAFDIFNRYKHRSDQRFTSIYELISTGFDFSLDEDFYYDRETANWAESQKELDDYWRKRIKNEMLNLIVSGKEVDKAKELLKKRYENQERQFTQLTSEDVYQLFMRSYLSSVDPHTSYFSPREAENFNIAMRLSLEGIGAQLRTINEYTTVASVIVGGPADKQGELKAEDKIIAVAQDKDEFVDVIGWRIDDVVNLIRGKKGSKVRLKVIPAGADVQSTPVEISIIRDKVKLEEQSAKASIKEVESSGKMFRLGVIDLPTFYADFEAYNRGDKDYKSSANDVHKLVDSLKQVGIDGILVDLRNNGGGSLSEAVALTGLFIKDGPVVQVKDKQGNVEVLKDLDKNVVYDGPLLVLINQYSASASEIFAGAIQDYRRGLVVGMQSFGKGTVQRILDLGYYSKNPKIGQIKLTTSKFYRITGESTQHKGVVPDILIPTRADHAETGESSYDHALTWDKINATGFSMFNLAHTDLSQVLKRHENRTKKSIEFKQYNEGIEEYKQNSKKKFVTLSEKKRRAQQAEEQEKRRMKVNEKRKALGLKALKKDEKIPSEKASDFILEESSFILTDLISALKDA